jgi:hypothetical protein
MSVASDEKRVGYRCSEDVVAWKRGVVAESKKAQKKRD